MAGCATGDPMYAGTFGGLTKLFDEGIDGILNDIATAILNAAVSLFADVANNIPTIVAKPDGDGSYQLPSVDQIRLQVNWLVVLIAVGSLLFAAARMALERRGQAGTAAMRGLVRMILVAGGSTFVIVQLAALGDSYSNYLYDSGVKKELAFIGECGSGNGLVSFLLIIIGLLLIVAAIIHIILLYIRLGVMVVLTGTLPVAAAASMTDWGGTWWRRHMAWLVGWLAFKPATALVIYAGTVMINSTGTDATAQKIAGCGVLLLSAVSLPALLRLVVPATMALGSAAGDGNAGVASASGATATGAIATGAGALRGPALGFARRGRFGTGEAGANGASVAGAGGSVASEAGKSRSSLVSSSSSGSSAGSSTLVNGAQATQGAGRSTGRRVAAGAARAAAGAAGLALGAVEVIGGQAAKQAEGVAKHTGNVVRGSLPNQDDERER